MSRVDTTVRAERQAWPTSRRGSCTLALGSLYYLPEEDMRRVARAIADRSPRLVLQCNVREEIGREDADQYRRASVEFAVDLLDNGFTSVVTTAPRGYSRPLVEGRRP